jgi:hypothetical protein
LFSTVDTYKRLLGNDPEWCYRQRRSWSPNIKQCDKVCKLKETVKADKEWKKKRQINIWITCIFPFDLRAFFHLIYVHFSI